MSLGLEQSREIAFVPAKAVTSVWSPSAHTDFRVHHKEQLRLKIKGEPCATVWGQGPPVPH